MIGLCGAHRTGKSTLAKAYADRHGIPFFETSVSAIWRELGYDPAALYDFETRLGIQEEILERIDQKYGAISGTEFVTDRTPIDMAGYLLGDAIGDRVPDNCQDRVKAYVNKCFETTNKRFGVILLVQPGIALVKAEGKAAMNEAYIEHLNSLIFGLSVDESVKCSHFYMPRHMTNLDDRVSALHSAVTRSKSNVLANYESLKAQGTLTIH